MKRVDYYLKIKSDDLKNMKGIFFICFNLNTNIKERIEFKSFRETLCNELL